MLPSAWSVIPFVLLLFLIAMGPLFFEHFWHKKYPVISMGLALLVVIYYVFMLGNSHSPVHAAIEYIQFISLLASLFIASGGILIKIDSKGTPMANTILLILGSVIANFIGTTGASMLLIRPFIRLNKNRIKPYHIVFFIFMVSNVGGSLTPIGDPPLFLGFLKGIPFFWTLFNNFLPWVFVISILALVFYFYDKRNKTYINVDDIKENYTGKITIKGNRNFFWLAIIIGAVFIDPNVFDWVPYILYDGQKVSFVRELIMLSTVVLSYMFANKEALSGNEFEFEPIREVAFLFIGIFGTMIPALELVGNFASSEAGIAMINQNSLYWGTGVLSAVLDNAPTYLNFLAAGISSKGGSMNNLADVKTFAAGGYANSIIELTAISLGAVFFGAMTYIGNGPNFMVKSIAEQIGIKMPSFLGYVIMYSIPILLPILFFVWIIFFYFQ